MGKLGACRKVGLGVAMLFGLCIGSANATTELWYTGDEDGLNQLASQVAPSLPTFDQMVYDSFIVPAGSEWDVQEVWANELSLNGIIPNSASWEIRSGVSDGSGGTLIAGGINFPPNPCVSTPTGRTETVAIQIGTTTVLYSSVPEYQVMVPVGSVILGPGTYWLGVAGAFGISTAFAPAPVQFLDSSTSGANPIVVPGDDIGDSFVYNPSAGYDFLPVADLLLAGGPWDYSMGVAGVLGPSPVPEPISMIFFGTGLVGVFGYVARRRNR